MDTTMLNAYKLPNYLAEALNMNRYIANPLLIRIEKNILWLWQGRRPNMGYFKDFGGICFMLNTKDNLQKFDSKTLDSILLVTSPLTRYIELTTEAL